MDLDMDRGGVSPTDLHRQRNLRYSMPLILRTGLSRATLAALLFSVIVVTTFLVGAAP